MIAEMNGETFEYNSNLEMLMQLMGPGGFVEKFPEGGTLTLRAPNGETLDLTVKAGVKGEGEKMVAFNNRFLGN